MGKGRLDNLAVLGVRAATDHLRYGQLDFLTPKKQAISKGVAEDDFGTILV